MKRLLCLALLLAAGVRRDDAAKYTQFVEENTGSCVQRNGVQIQVRNTHPTRRIKVWLDRYQAGVGTGDPLAQRTRPAPSPKRWAARAAMPASRSGASCGRYSWTELEALRLRHLHAAAQRNRSAPFFIERRKVAVALGRDRIGQRHDHRRAAGVGVEVEEAGALGLRSLAISRW